MDTKLVHITPVGGDLYVVRPFHHHMPDQGLPGGPGTPGNELPTIPGVPDNTLPTTPPPTVPPGSYLVIYKGADGKWKWATSANAPTPLPEPPTGPVAAPKA